MAVAVLIRFRCRAADLPHLNDVRSNICIGMPELEVDRTNQGARGLGVPRWNTLFRSLHRRFVRAPHYSVFSDRLAKGATSGES
jgi:hypothetical protein